jgi:hypothetical protein
MKNITLSAENTLIDQARALARLRGTTLNDAFRIWLEAYTQEDVDGLKLAQTRAMLDDLSTPVAGQTFVSLDYRYAAESNNRQLRDDDNERESRILRRLDGAAP